ncbi:MAG: carboxypeptidase-like regulatory domain-containing protein, partial [Armatimonadota bacterium]
SRGNYFFPNYADPVFLSPGTYSVTAVKSGYSTQVLSNIQVSAGQNTVVDIAMTAVNLATLTGTVRDPITCLGLSGVNISLSPGGRTATTGPDGKYTIASLTPSTYTLSASKAGFRGYSVGNVSVGAGLTTTLDFYLAPGLEPVGNPLITTGEMDTGSFGLADGWEAWDGQSHPDIYAIDATQRISGRASQRIKAGGDWWAGEWTNYGACATGVVYRIEAWAKTSGTSAPAKVIGIYSRWGEGIVSSFECYPQMTGTNGWTLYVGRAVAPYFIDQSNGRLRVELHPPESGSGYAWFDRVWVGQDPDQSGNPICCVANLTATAGEASVTLNWINPPTSAFPTFTGTMIRRMTDRYPVTPSEGTLVADVAAPFSTCTDTAVMPGTRYYYAAFAHAAGPSNYSKGSYASAVPIDSTPPTTPVVTDDGIYTITTSSIHASWSSSDPQSGISDYQYAVGTTAGGGDVVDWTNAGTATQAQIGVTLLPNKTYYVSVEATNGVGLTSAVGTSDGITVATACSIGNARLLPAGSAVFFSDAVVTSRSADWPGLWIESLDRASGMQVSANTSHPRGDRLDVAGIVQWDDGVPKLTNPEFKQASAGSTPTPLGATNSNLANDRKETLSYAGM